MLPPYYKPEPVCYPVVGPRPESVQALIESRLMKVESLLSGISYRSSRKANDLLGPVDEPKAPCNPDPNYDVSPIAPCFAERMYNIIERLERQAGNIDKNLMRLEGF
jgi:hypothetical protein